MQNKNKKKAAIAGNPLFKGFLNLNLTEEDKAIIKGTAYDNSSYASDLEKWVDSGFKFTFSADDYNHCFQVIGTKQDKDHKDYGIMLAGRGSTPIKAFKQWVYIQTRLIQDTDWVDLLDNATKFEIDD